MVAGQHLQTSKFRFNRAFYHCWTAYFITHQYLIVPIHWFIEKILNTKQWFIIGRMNERYELVTSLLTCFGMHSFELHCHSSSLQTTILQSCKTKNSNYFISYFFNHDYWIMKPLWIGKYLNLKSLNLCFFFYKNAEVFSTLI